MEIIKKWKESGKDMAWVSISDKDAHLFIVTGKSDFEVIEETKKFVLAKEQLKLVQEQIKILTDALKVTL